MMADTLAPLAPLEDADLRRWRACERRFWLQRQAGTDDAAPTAAEPMEADVVHGPALDAALRASFPAGVRISPPHDEASWARAVEHTHIALAEATPETEGWALFGACLVSDDGARARIDLVTRGLHGWRLFKLRYATVGNEADVDAVALWAHVAARSGLRVQSVGLLLVDTGFIYPGHGCYAGLLREVDLGPTLGSRPVARWLTAMQACARAPEPAVPLGAPCTQPSLCEHLCHCALPDAPAARPADARVRLEIVGRELAAQLRAAGHANLHSVPLDALPDARLRRAARAVQHNAPVLEPEAAVTLRALPYPRHFLRFETIGFAVPVWAGTRPYQVLPFQWSCDTVAALGLPPQHHGFLADPTGDPRRAFSQSLLLAVGATGPVLAYNAGFERNRLRELAHQFEDLGPALLALAERIVDLFQIARAHYYHPAMAGSWSAKSVFAAIAPDLGAERFDCEGLRTPLEAFARALQSGLPAPELQHLRAALQAHGQRQTGALRRMVALFEHPHDREHLP